MTRTKPTRVRVHSRSRNPPSQNPSPVFPEPEIYEKEIHCHHRVVARGQLRRRRLKRKLVAGVILLILLFVLCADGQSGFRGYSVLLEQNPGYMKDNFVICIESLHVADRGEQDNVSRCMTRATEAISRP